MGEIWIEFFQVDFNIASLRDVKVANIKSLQGQDDEFEDAYDAILNAYDRWLQLDISTREWRIARASNERFYWVDAIFSRDLKID